MTHAQRQQHWQQHLTLWQQSGLNGAQFCEQHALSYHQFQYWRHKFAETSPVSGFASVVASKPAHSLHLNLPCGSVLEGIDASNVATVAQLLEALR